MTDPTYIRLPISDLPPLPSQFSQDVRYTRGLVEYFINRHTKPGDSVLDPFAGFGTTLLVAKEMERMAYGVEILENLTSYLTEDLGLNNVIKGDVARIDLARLPPIELVMTSPPFMGREDQADATTGYQYAGTYDEYLDRLAYIFTRIQTILSPTGHVVVEVSNLKQQNSITTLAWDVGNILSKIYSFQGEIIVAWEGPSRDKGIYGYGYDHSYCLVYANSSPLSDQ